MRPRPAMAALAFTATAVVTAGTLARHSAGHEARLPTVAAVAAPAGDEAADAGAAPAAVEPKTPATPAAPTVAEVEPSAPEEKAEARRLEVDAGMSTRVNAVGTRHTTAGAELRNPHPEAAYGVDVVFNLKDASGAVLDWTRETVNYLPAHGSRIVAPLELGFDAPGEAASVEVVTKVAEFAPDTGPPAGDDVHRRPQGRRLEVEDASLEAEDYVTRVTGQVVNRTADVARFASLHCVLRHDDRIVGGTNTGLTHAIAPGTTVEFESLLTVTPDDVDEVDCEAHASPRS